MAKNFNNTSIEYNLGFADGLLWVLKNGNKKDNSKILSMIENIRKTNDEILMEEYKRIGRLEIK